MRAREIATYKQGRKATARAPRAPSRSRVAWQGQRPVTQPSLAKLLMAPAVVDRKSLQKLLGTGTVGCESDGMSERRGP